MCEVYFAGVNSEFEQLVCDGLNMKKGSLPFRYLGVPLAARKLMYAKCKELVARITKLVAHCSSKCLSYRARLCSIK